MSRIPIYLMTLFSVLVALASYRFLGLGLVTAFFDMVGHLEARWLAFVLHVAIAPVALVLGAAQLYPRIRAKRVVLHRWIGRVYAVSVLIAGVSGLIIALGAEGGLWATFGFGILAVLWVYATLQGVLHARARRITLHRQWMVRSFALTFAAVTLRLYLPFFFIFGEMSYHEASNYVAWLCWVPNLLFAEALIRGWFRRGEVAVTEA